MITRDAQGNISNPASQNFATDSSGLPGFPVRFGRAVGGDLGAATDSGMRLLGGDFSQLRYGYADQVRVKVTDSATVTDATGQAVSMWQTNQVALLVEVTFGWVVGDLS